MINELYSELLIDHDEDLGIAAESLFNKIRADEKLLQDYVYDKLDMYTIENKYWVRIIYKRKAIV